MKKTIAILFILFSSFGFSQDLTCTDFKEGTFMMYTSIEGTPVVFEVKRSGNKQTEDVLRAPKDMFPDHMKTFYINLKWIDDCNYRAFSDETKGIDEISKSINDNNGIFVKKIKIEGRCFHYKSSWKSLDDRKEISLYGRLCKENQ